MWNVYFAADHFSKLNMHISWYKIVKQTKLKESSSNYMNNICNFIKLNTCRFQMAIHLLSSINSKYVRNQWSAALQQVFCEGDSSLVLNPNLIKLLANTKINSESIILIPKHSLLTFQWDMCLSSNQTNGVSNSRCPLCKVSRQLSHDAYISIVNNDLSEYVIISILGKLWKR